MYSLLTHPDNSAIFKSIDAVSERKVNLDTPERREIYIEQTSTVGVLFFKRQFSTALNVVETPQDLAASFDLAKQGIMSDFRVRIPHSADLRHSAVYARPPAPWKTVPKAHGATPAAPSLCTPPSQARPGSLQVYGRSSSRLYVRSVLTSLS